MVLKHSKHKSVNRYHADQDAAWGTDALEARRELIRRHYDNIVTLCCEAWNKLIDQPKKIMSIGQRQWAHGF